MTLRDRLARLPVYLAITALTAVFAAGGRTALGAAGKASPPQAPAVPLVANQLQPRDGVVTPKLTELWSVGGENDPQAELINRPYEIRLAADGTVYVLDWGDCCVRVFDPRGKFLRQVGRKGQGPGDFDTPCWFDVDDQGRIHVTDMRNMRVTRYDAAGKFESSFRLTKPSSPLRVDSRGRIWTGETSTGEPQLSGDFKVIQRMLTVVRYDGDGRNPLRLGPFASDKMMMKAVSGGGVVSGSSPLTPQCGWGVGPDGRLWLGHNAGYELGVYDPDGKPLFRFSRPFKPVHNKGFDKIGPEYRKNTVVPETLPAFAPDIFFDEAGNAWLRMFRNEDEGEPFRYDVFSPRGTYLNQYVLPCRIYQALNGRMIAVVETEEGFKSLKCYRVS